MWRTRRFLWRRIYTRSWSNCCLVKTGSCAYTRACRVLFDWNARFSDHLSRSKCECEEHAGFCGVEFTLGHGLTVVSSKLDTLTCVLFHWNARFSTWSLTFLGQSANVKNTPEFLWRRIYTRSCSVVSLKLERVPIRWRVYYSTGMLVLVITFLGQSANVKNTLSRTQSESEWVHRAPTDPALVSAGLRLIPCLLNSSSEWLQEHARSAKAFHLREVYFFFHLREVYFLLSLAIFSPRSKKKKKKKKRRRRRG